jgi:hypothetical protein
MKKSMKPGSKMPENTGETTGEAGADSVAVKAPEKRQVGVARDGGIHHPTKGRKGYTAKGSKIGRPSTKKTINELHKVAGKIPPGGGKEGSVCLANSPSIPPALQSHLLTPEAVFAWNEALAGLAIESMKGAPKKILISKVGDLKILDDLFRRAQGITGGGGNDRPGNLIQVNILSDIGKERPENVRVVTSPIAEPVDS